MFFCLIFNDTRQEQLKNDIVKKDNVFSSLLYDHTHLFLFCIAAQEKNEVKVFSYGDSSFHQFSNASMKIWLSSSKGCKIAKI